MANKSKGMQVRRPKLGQNIRMHRHARHLAHRAQQIVPVEGAGPPPAAAEGGAGGEALPVVTDEMPEERDNLPVEGAPGGETPPVVNDEVPLDVIEDLEEIYNYSILEEYADQEQANKSSPLDDPAKKRASLRNLRLVESLEPEVNDDHLTRQHQSDPVTTTTRKKLRFGEETPLRHDKKFDPKKPS